MTDTVTSPTPSDATAPAHRYNADLAAVIEQRWQQRWQREGTFEAPNPAGPMAEPDKVAGRPKLYVLDMFPYPSGSGLHVGHPLGYIATDVFGRFKRMTGYNVLHALGYDAFGLPAEQYAVQTGTHPRVTTEANIANMRRQLGRLGLAHDPRRSVATTDLEFYKWTQWIFLQVYNSWYDEILQTARPIADLIAAYETGDRPTPNEQPWASLSQSEQDALVDARRLAYISQAPVNWCPGLGTVLANEEVTADGRSERGNYPVHKRNLRQWMMRITAYSERLIADLERLSWPEPIKLMQRNWIGRSEGARVRFALAGSTDEVEVFTTRPDTLFGATYLVLAPEHPLLDTLVPDAWPAADLPGSWTGGAATPGAAVAAYRRLAGSKSDVERQVDSRDKTGVFTGAYAVNPVDGRLLPVFAADYVLMGYGTGAIMAVPAEDERDYAFAEAFVLPVIRTVAPPEDFAGGAYTGVGPAINSGFLDGHTMPETKQLMTEWLVERGLGEATVTFKLRDWLFSRQRYWGEPFPIVYDEAGRAIALPESMLPVELPDVDDYSPKTFAPDDFTSAPEPPLGRAQDWVNVTLDLGDGPKPYRRETNTMPQWAGSCWYELRYLDPSNSERFVDADVERYWMGPTSETHIGGVDLYVGGAEHAVLHLLYSRFWHKVLFDLGHVSSGEPFHGLVNQGYIQAAAFLDARGIHVPADQVDERDGRFLYEGEPVTREYGKMGKSLKNAVTPDDMFAEYGADTLRIYEMSMGPLEVSRPWETRAVVGSYRFLQRVWRMVVDEETGAVRVSDDGPSPELNRLLHKTIDGVRTDFADLKFNTSVAKLIELTNAVTKTGTPAPRVVVEAVVLMLAPLAPHTAEELWSRLGHSETLTYQAFPVADAALLVEDTVTCVVQVGGKVRDRIEVPVGISEAELLDLALATPGAQRAVEGQAIRTTIVRPPRLVNIVLG